MCYDLMDKESVQGSAEKFIYCMYQRLITGNIQLGPLLV